MRCEGIDALTGKAVELQIAQGRITGIKHIDTSEPLPYLTAGFFDIQVNGYRGHGHSAAEAALIDKAIEAGARMTTHLGNGSHNLLPRLKNYIWQQLADDRLAASMICDGFHLPPAVVKVFRRAKGLKRLILASDVAYFGGLAPGLYRFENTEIQVFEDGHLGLAGTDFLAGAAHLLDRDIAVFMKFTGCSLAETLPLCTSNPAKLLGVPQSGSEIAINAPANLVLFNYRQGSQRLEIIKTWRAGRLVFEA